MAIMGRSKIVYFFAGLIMGGKNSENFVQNDNCIENFDCCSTAKTRGLCFSALKRKLPLFTMFCVDVLQNMHQYRLKEGPQNPRCFAHCLHLTPKQR